MHNLKILSPTLHPIELPPIPIIDTTCAMCPHEPQVTTTAGEGEGPAQRGLTVDDEAAAATMLMLSVKQEPASASPGRRRAGAGAGSSGSKQQPRGRGRSRKHDDAGMPDIPEQGDDSEYDAEGANAAAAAATQGTKGAKKGPKTKRSRKTLEEEEQAYKAEHLKRLLASKGPAGLHVPAAAPPAAAAGTSSAAGKRTPRGCQAPKNKPRSPIETNGLRPAKKRKMVSLSNVAAGAAVEPPVGRKHAGADGEAAAGQGSAAAAVVGDKKPGKAQASASIAGAAGTSKAASALPLGSAVKDLWASAAAKAAGGLCKQAVLAGRSAAANSPKRGGCRGSDSCGVAIASFFVAQNNFVRQLCALIKKIVPAIGPLLYGELATNFLCIHADAYALYTSDYADQWDFISSFDIAPTHVGGQPRSQ